MERFGYVRASSVGDALTLLNEPGFKSRPLAGSTDLLLLIRHTPDLCNRVVDISLIPELRRIERQGEWVSIGAAATFSEVLECPIVTETAPLLAGESGEWYHVRLEGGKQGWVSNRVIK